MSRYTKIHISIDAMQHNLAYVRQLCRPSQQPILSNIHQAKDIANKAQTDKTQILAMVKANAYGHGIENAIVGFQDADALGVACMQEALQIRDMGWQKPICLIEGVFSLAEWQQAKTINAFCVIHHQQQLDWALAQPMTDRPVWLKVNTGMNRLGFCATHDDAIKHTAMIYHQLIDGGYQVVLMTHFANADDAEHHMNEQQKAQLQKLITAIKTHKTSSDNRFNDIAISVCNSGATVNWQDCHAKWVRPGIMLYGATPVLKGVSLNRVSQTLQTEKNTHLTTKIKSNVLKPVMTFTAKVIAIHALKKGEFVGYGSTWQAQTDARIAIVSVGYGDGYPRVIEHGQVFCEGVFCDIVGRVSMDMLAIDISTHAHIALGSVVELWGDNLSIDAVAKTANTISYELLCRLTNRPDRFCH